MLTLSSRAPCAFPSGGHPWVGHDRAPWGTPTPHTCGGPGRNAPTVRLQLLDVMLL
jgi:hypothetical protein